MEEKKQKDEKVMERVVPTIPRRRPINRKRNLAPLNISVTSSQKKEIPSKQSQEDNEIFSKVSAGKRLSGRKSQDENGIESLPSTSQIAEEADSSNVPCPICNKSFEKDKIENHAATCGDEPVTRSSTKVSRLTCQYCDKVVYPEMDYDAHTRECEAKKQAN
ncbi:hypothetical protein NQ317_010671 [Molorchus minor]|uniref:Uncharacterized protein n=1 Tax=Molorchus minor TaxID=1323400 RepID=A0ABQ9K7T6_9CUCU|nr:hypothetical protein NQ317_010671 [Molorchus minor]